MDRERKKRLETVRLIFREVIMVLTVVITVIILTFIAMGYNVDKDGVLNQSGLIQIKSTPSSAIVEIDNEIIASRTAMSRMLSAGKHLIRLSKTGYDTWEKNVEIESGWLLKLDYPRLFPLNREAEKVSEYPADIRFFVPSLDRGKVLYSVSSESDWTLMEIKGDEVTETKLDVTKWLEQKKVLDIAWNNSADKVLVEVENNNGEKEWSVLNLKNLENSVNISQSFGMRIAEATFISDNGERIAIVENGNLRQIMLAERTLSQVLASNLADFITEDGQIIYLTNGNELEYFQDGVEDILLATYSPEQKVKVAMGEYLNKKYIVSVVDQEMTVYRGKYPTENETLSDMEKVISTDLGFVPTDLKVHANGELFMAKNGNNVAIFDAELSVLSQFQVESDYIFFLDNYLLATISDDKLIVRDFDGANRREIASATGTGMISKNNNYLYYLKKDHGNTNIFREKIVD